MKIRTSTVGKVKKNNSHQRGFTYVVILVAVVVVGLLAGVATVMTSNLMKAEREAELLYRGQAYKDAIKRYYEAGGTAGRIKDFPHSLEDLLLDPRFPNNKRHLRALYPDPMSANADKDKPTWTLMRAPDGGISGVASASKEAPLKKAHFPKGLESFADAQSYAEWVFEYVPIRTTPVVSPPTSPSQVGPQVRPVN